MPTSIINYKSVVIKQQKCRLNRSGLYDTQRWRKESRLFLKLNPLCVECLAYNITEQARVVDHILPHNGSEELFWDAANWQSLCTQHHNTKSAKEKKKRVY